MVQYTNRELMIDTLTDTEIVNVFVSRGCDKCPFCHYCMKHIDDGCREVLKRGIMGKIPCDRV